MINLNDLTVIIPLMVATDDRIDNLDMVLRYFKKYFSGYEVLIVEQDKKSSDKINQFLGEFVKHIFVESGELFHKTKLLNIGFNNSSRKYVTAYDCDVIFEPDAVGFLMETMREKNITFGMPFNECTLNISGPLKKEFAKNIDFGKLPKVKSNRVGDVAFDLATNIHPLSTGGATFFNRETVMKCGGYNEHFHCWGYEDDEMIVRMVKLGHSPIRISDQNCYHVDHARTTHSNPNHVHYNNNMQEINKIKSMNREQLIAYIGTWPWIK